MISLKKLLLALISASVVALIALFFIVDDKAIPLPENVRAPQAIPVSVEVMKSEKIQIWSEYSAHLEAVAFAEIRPQVSGIITEVRFQDGQMVKLGEVIYVIDPRPYKAILDHAQADLATTKNNLTLATKEYNRAKELITTKAISQRVLDTRDNVARTAQDSLRGALARTEQAKINVDYAYIKAPISGKISRAEIKVGNLVQSGANAPLLTTIVATNEIYADFDVDEKTYLAILGDSPEKIPVELSIGSEAQKYNGTIDSFDNRIDPISGTIRARALFKNKQSNLLPGMFATIKMGQSKVTDVITIPEASLGTDQDRKFVYVVGKDSVVAYRSVEIGMTTNGRRIIKSGLNAGDMVIVEGLIKIRPGVIAAPQIQDKEV